MAYLFGLIVVMAILPVAIAGALDMRVLHCMSFFVLGAIAIAIAINRPMLLITAVIRVVSGVAQSKLTLCSVSTTLVLAHLNLITKLTFELKVRVFLNLLKLHALKRTVIFVLVELGFKKLCDRLEGLGL